MFEEQEQEELLDNYWIKEFESIDKGYEIFYTEDLNYIKIQCIYIDKNDNIQKIADEKLFMTNKNCVSREEIVGILKRNNEQKYTILSLLKYNIDIEPLDIKHFLRNGNQFEFLTVVKNIDTIPLNKSINMFHDLNTLFVIFYEKALEKRHHSSTKKIFIQSHKKTQRKPFRD
jgi:hypothetical protein